MSDAWTLYLGTVIPVTLFLILAELKAIRQALDKRGDAPARRGESDTP